ncbi:MAG: Bax inhibitor-1 family protein, partial [Phycisphaeraceae bacterium]|nr:Bax inhibitor-1 family protein [Phycisphaeraceae bacterium]
MFENNTSTSTTAVAGAAAQAPAAERKAFVRRTYAHLLGAVLAFVGLEATFFLTLPVEEISRSMMGSPINWLLVLGAFMLVGYAAQKLAMSRASTGVQYAGLGLYVAIEALIFLPMLCLASEHYPGVIQSAALVTVAIFSGLTGFAWLTGHDFSW